jgi:hypothetical protein
MRRTGTLRQGWLVVALVAMACLSCSGNDGERRHPVTTPGFLAGQYRIEFSLPGDDFASMQELENISRIKERIMRQAVGEVISTGSGMGTITILLKIRNRESLQVIDTIIRQAYPNAKYIMVPDLQDSGDLEGK